MITNVYWSSCKVSVILVRLEFYRQIFEKYSHKIPRKSMRHDEAKSHFRNFAHSPKNKQTPCTNHNAFLLKDQPVNIPKEKSIYVNNKSQTNV
jgi:hypothetical protein